MFRLICFKNLPQPKKGSFVFMMGSFSGSGVWGRISRRGSFILVVWSLIGFSDLKKVTLVNLA